MRHAPLSNEQILQALSESYNVVAAITKYQVFLTSGIGKIAAWDSNVAYMATRRLPAIPILLAAAALVEVVGSGCVLLGFRARAAAFVMAPYTAVVTLIFHDFWNANGMSALMQRTQFLENVAIVGGLIAIGVAGAGRFSLDAYLRRQR